MLRVVEACCAYLRKQLHPSNCLGIAAFADSQGKLTLLSSIENSKSQRIKDSAPLKISNRILAYILSFTDVHNILILV